jgi:hypothetical protein
MSPKQVWSWHLVALDPSYFLSVVWHRETLYWLGVQCVEVLILGAFFPPSAAPASQQHFCFMDLTLSASAFWSLSWICCKFQAQERIAAHGQ